MKKILNKIEKNRDNKMNAEARKYYENLSKQIQTKLENPENAKILDNLKQKFKVRNFKNNFF